MTENPTEEPEHKFTLDDFLKLEKIGEGRDLDCNYSRGKGFF